MTDEPIPSAPEPSEQPADRQPDSTPSAAPEPGANRRLEPKPAAPKQAAPKPPAAKPAAPKADPPKPARAKPAAPKPARAQAAAPKPAQPKPAPAQRKAEPKPPKAPKLQAKPASDAPKPRAAKPEPKVKPPQPAEPPKPAPVVQRKAEPALAAPPPVAPKPPTPKVEPAPVVPPRPAAPILAAQAPSSLAAAPVESNLASSEPKSPAPPAVQRAPEPITRSQTPLDVLGRRLASRLERTESALSPWTQQTLRLQRAAPAAEAETPKATPGARTPGEPVRAQRSSTALGSLARRLQRQEQQGASGTFGRLAGGVERAERFAGRIAAHFPALAAKYEPPAAPEAGAPAQPAAPSAPNFTYYPEGAASSSSAGQPTMTAAEMLKQIGATSSSATVQRTPTPETPAPKPAAPKPPPQPQAPRDPRRIRRFSKIEEVPQPGEERARPPVAPPTPPPAQAIQRKPEPARPAAPPRTPPPERPETKAQTPAAPRRRRSNFEEVSTPSSTEAPVQRRPEPESPPAAPTPATSDDAGPLRWDHLGDLPPSMQRQLERVQQRLAEQSGLTQPPANNIPAADQDAERPFHPRNPNPPPPRLAESLPSRLPSPESEAEAPISFGPDLQPRTTAVQRQAEPALPHLASQADPVSSPARTEFEMSEAEPLDQPSDPTVSPAPIGSAEAPSGLQRAPERAQVIETPPSGQAMPLVTPPPVPDHPEVEPSELPEPNVAFAPPAPADASPPIQRSTGPNVPDESGLAHLTLRAPAPAEPEMPMEQRASETPRAESQLPAERPVEPLTLRQPVAPSQPPPSSIVQRQPAEPAPEPAAATINLSQRSPAAVETPAKGGEPRPIEPTPPASQPPAASLQRALPDSPTTPVAPASRAQQPLTLRQPEPAESESPASRTTEPAIQLSPEAETSSPVAPSATERRPAVEKPAAEPLVLRQPAPPASPMTAPSQHLPEPAPAQRAQPAASQAAHSDKPTGATPGTTATDATAPKSPRMTNERDPFEAPPTVLAEIQREPIEAQAPLTLREPPAQLPAEELSAPAEPGPDAPHPFETSPAAPALQRQATAPDDLPLRDAIAPVIRDEAAPDAGVQSSAPDLTPTARIQRQSDPAIPQPALPLRVPPEASQAPLATETRTAGDIYAGARGEQPRAGQPSMPPQPPLAAVQRRAETPGPRGPTPSMPLRAPTTAMGGPAEVSPSSGRPANAPPQLSLGSQIYARGVKDAQMAVMGPLATNLRRSVQRRPAASGSAGTQTLPAAGAAPLMGLARSTHHTSVLPQARLQREDEPSNRPQNQLVPVPQPSGTLPLAPPGPAPVNPNKTTPSTSTALVPGRPSPSLPLAPVIARDGGNDDRQLAITGQDDSDSELDDLLADLEDDGLEQDDEADSQGHDLDDLAEQLLPYIKRLMAVERQRDEPI